VFSLLCAVISGLLLELLGFAQSRGRSQESRDQHDPNRGLMGGHCEACWGRSGWGVCEGEGLMGLEVLVYLILASDMVDWFC